MLRACLCMSLLNNDCSNGKKKQILLVLILIAQRTHTLDCECLATESHRSGDDSINCIERAESKPPSIRCNNVNWLPYFFEYGWLFFDFGFIYCCFIGHLEWTSSVSAIDYIGEIFRKQNQEEKKKNQQQNSTFLSFFYSSLSSEVGCCDVTSDYNTYAG